MVKIQCVSAANLNILVPTSVLIVMAGCAFGVPSGITGEFVTF